MTDFAVPDVEPPLGTRIRLANGRTFERTDPSLEFHWRDGTGWYRWTEVRNRARREGGRVLLTIDLVPDDTTGPRAEPARGPTAVADLPLGQGDHR